MKCRVRFAKYGVMRFIGHLDMMRYFQKAFRRAGIDVTYTNGFSPHQVLSFAAPLGVGLCSNGEYLDVELNSATSSEDMINKLNAQMVEGVRILSWKELPEGAGNAMASVAAASYTISFREDHKPVFLQNNTDVIPDKITDFLAQDEILVTKKTKRSEATIDIRPGIYEIALKDNIFHLTVNASSAGNIKPAMVLDAYFKFCELEFDSETIHITREDTFLSKDGKLAPLDAIGEDIKL